MTDHKKNYSLMNIGLMELFLNKEFSGPVGKISGKYFLGKVLGLTGCEISLNCLPAGKGMPFVHAHKKNEEVYIVLSGKGTFFMDGEEFPIQEGSLIRVSPEGARSWTAGEEDLYFICIQAEAGSLHQATFDDGYQVKIETSWMEK